MRTLLCLMAFASQLIYCADSHSAIIISFKADGVEGPFETTVGTPFLIDVFVSEDLGGTTLQTYGLDFAGAAVSYTADFGIVSVNGTLDPQWTGDTSFVSSDSGLLIMQGDLGIPQVGSPDPSVLPAAGNEIRIGTISMVFDTPGSTATLTAFDPDTSTSGANIVSGPGSGPILGPGSFEVLDDQVFSQPWTTTVKVAAVPEPSTFSFMCFGVAMVTVMSRIRRKQRGRPEWHCRDVK